MFVRKNNVPIQILSNDSLKYENVVRNLTKTIPGGYISFDHP